MMKNVKKSLKSKFFLENKKEKRFLENGSKFLKNLIADCNGKSIPIRNFSSSQILEATNNFKSPCFVTNRRIYEWYKCIIENRTYMIKKLSDFVDIDYIVSWLYNDIVLSARMSNHNNFLKLFGCCLEFRAPVLVFEYAEHGLMSKNGCIMVNGQESRLPLSSRLKIAKEIAIALTYLHTAFPKITVHRDVKPASIFLDSNLNAKLSCLSNAVTLPEGKTFIVDDFLGFWGGRGPYLDPEYASSGLVTEYTDIYAFGVFLMVILIGTPTLGSSVHSTNKIVMWVKGLYESGNLDELIEKMMMEDVTMCQRLQVDACTALALRCCEKYNVDRPKMINVAKELKQIQRMEQSLDVIKSAQESLDGVEITEESIDDTYGSSIVKTKKCGYKIEIMLILSFCLGFLVALLLGKAYK